MINLYSSIITETITSRTIISYFLLVANIGQYNNADKDYLGCKCKPVIPLAEVITN